MEGRGRAHGGAVADARSEAASLEGELAKAAAPGDKADGPMWTLRRQYLKGQLGAIRARLAMLQGKTVHVRRGVGALYDAVAPTHTEAEFEAVLKQLSDKFPGEGALIERYDRYKLGFVIPAARLGRVFQEAIRACRERTQTHVALPPASGSPSSTSPASPGAATTGTRGSTAA